jgi:dTDP-L-rhamnose 4-epimerase
MDRILITGGAGFIGSHLADLLLSRGYEVRALDSLEPQVHGPGRARPPYLDPAVELLTGDVRDGAAVARAMEGCSAVLHLAAAVGVAQSMYEMRRYTDINSVGAAVVLEEIARRRADLRSVVVASSMSIYGEGAYLCPSCGVVHPGIRSRGRLEARRWEPACPGCGADCSPAPVRESKPLAPTSIYAVNKRDHEEMFLVAGEAYGFPVVALRFFNVYGPRQALSNPYTGVAAIFASRLLNGGRPLVFEDGMQSRDFVHVRDVARALACALDRAPVAGGVYNVGTGRPTSVLALCRMLATGLGSDIEPLLTGEYRAGDIRHCYADVSAAAERLGFTASVRLEEGMAELASWLSGRTADDLQEKAAAELRERGLAR